MALGGGREGPSDQRRTGVDVHAGGGEACLFLLSWGRIHRDKVMLSVDLILQLRAQIRMETGLGQSGFSYPVPTLVSALLR